MSAPSVVRATTPFVGLLASRPASAPARTSFFATDDNGGTLYISDGTNWLIAASRGLELGSAQITSQFSVVRAGSDITSDVTGLSVTVTGRGRPAVVRAGTAFLQHTAVGGAAVLTIVRTDTSAIIARAQAYSPGTASASTAFAGPVARARVAALTSGSSYTFKARLGSLFANGSAVLDAQTDGPAYIEVIEV